MFTLKNGSSAGKKLCRDARQHGAGGDIKVERRRNGGATNFVKRLQRPEGTRVVDQIELR
jgi:hypothetical protein